MKINKIITTILICTISLLSSCIEEIMIDTPDGTPLIGINGYISNEYKKHRIVISKTTDFYSDEEAEMISGAEVFIYDGFDTIYFKETKERGYYETIDSVAGMIGRTYKLSVNIIDEEGEHNYYAQSTMMENVNQIDSMRIKKVRQEFFDIYFDTVTGLYPYFQSLPDPNTQYLVDIAINDTFVNNSLLHCDGLSLLGLSGMYFNGEEMVNTVGEQSVFTLERVSYYPDGYSFITNPWFVTDDDKITLRLYRITPDFSTYLTDIKSSFGSNPMMGMPHNVSSNIYPGGKSVGFFEATSVVEASVIYDLQDIRK